MPIYRGTQALMRNAYARGPEPGVDERLVVPETSREEMVRGEKILTMPANPPHAEQQQQLSYLIQSTTKSGFVGATDMLTRTSERSDFAVDTSIGRLGSAWGAPDICDFCAGRAQRSL